MREEEQQRQRIVKIPNSINKRGVSSSGYGNALLIEEPLLYDVVKLNDRLGLLQRLGSAGFLFANSLLQLPKEDLKA